jgi:DNA-binding NarL/FixJ family response regulator
MSVRILIIDDQAVVRRGVRAILEEKIAGIEIVEGGSADSALTLLQNGEWNVVVVDLYLRDRSGLQVLDEIRKLRPTIPILVLSDPPEEQFGVRALRAGASAYLNKSVEPDTLADAVRKVGSGGKYISPVVAERLAEALPAGFREPHETLSAREYEILLLLGSGMRVTEVARQLNLSDKTVSTYRARILEKMRLQTTAQLVRYVVERGLEAR